MKALLSNRNLYFIYIFILLNKKTIAYDVQPRDNSSSKNLQESFEYEIDDSECTASSSSQNPCPELSQSPKFPDCHEFIEREKCFSEIEHRIRNKNKSDVSIPKKSEIFGRNSKLRSYVDVGTQTFVSDDDGILNPKENKSTQTFIGHMRHSNLAILKEPYEFDNTNIYREGELSYENDDIYNLSFNKIGNIPFNKIADYIYNLNTCEAISLNEPNGEIFLTDFENGSIVKRPMEYLDLSKYNISNDELNRTQIPENDINFIICDLNSLDIDNFNSQLKRSLSDFYGWVVIRPAINNRKNIIGAVIFGNIGIAINENIKSRIVSFTLHEKQQIIKIEEFTSKNISRVIYFEQSKETTGNKYFSMRKYYPLTVNNWDESRRYVSFYTLMGNTYYTLDFNSQKNYHNIFVIETKDNETTYFPNFSHNIYISNVIFGNVKVLYEKDNIYRSVKVIDNGTNYFIEIYTIDSLGRKDRLLYKKKDSFKSDNIFTKIKYSKDGSIMYHELETLKEAYLIPVDFNIPQMIYNGQMWDMRKLIETCLCEKNYINDTVEAENVKFCEKCCGCKIDIDDRNISKEDMEKISFIQFSYKDYKQFGSIYIYLNPKLKYTHRLGKIKIGNTIFPLGSIGFVVSIKISKYNNKVMIKFIVLDGEKYNYIDYILKPDGESLRLATKYNLEDLKAKWLSIWDSDGSKLYIDLHLDKSVTALIKCGYEYEKDEVYYHGYDFTIISNIYWKNKLLSYPNIDEQKLIKRDVRVIYISNLRLVTIYSLYLTQTHEAKSKKIIFDVSKKYKYWNIDQQHFLQHSNYKFERISDEYASCKLRENRILRESLYVDMYKDKEGLNDIFRIIEKQNSTYYRINPEISPDVNIGNVEIGGMLIRQTGIHDILGVWIQDQIVLPYVYKIKEPNRKISIFINDGFKVMVIEYAEIKKDNEDAEYINIGPFPYINDGIMDIISYSLGIYMKKIEELSIEDRIESVVNEIEDECCGIIKSGILQKYKSPKENLENTTLYQIMCEFGELLFKEFMEEILAMDKDELENAEKMKCIYNAEVKIRNRKLLAITNV